MIEEDVMAMHKYLVVSYDADEQQWFYDFVLAEDAENASAIILKARPYVIAADATDEAQLFKLAKDLDEATDANIKSTLNTLARASE